MGCSPHSGFVLFCLLLPLHNRRLPENWVRLTKMPFCCSGGRPRLRQSRGVPPGGKAATARNLSASNFSFSHMLFTRQEHSLFNMNLAFHEKGNP
jgi:hypothetical protein